MAMQLNRKAMDHAGALIAGGKVNVEDFPFRFDQTDRQAMLGPEGKDWEVFQNMHLGTKGSGVQDMGHYDHPVGKAGEVHAAALVKARNDAWLAGDHAIAEGADKLLTDIRTKMASNTPMLAAAIDKLPEGMTRVTAADEVILPGFARLLGAVGTPEDPDYGFKWRVQIVEAGVDKPGNLNYPLEVLHAAAPLYEGVKVMALQEGQHTSGKNEYGKSVRDIVGWIDGVTPNKKGLEGTQHILAGAKWLRDNLVDAWGRGKQDLYGLSHDAVALLSKSGRPRDVLKIGKVDSVDVVYSPIAGGKFIRVAAAASSAGQEEDGMYKRLLAALAALRPDLGERIKAAEAKGDQLSDNEMMELLVAAGAVQGDVMLKIVAAMKDDGSALGKATELLATAQEENRKARVTAAQAMVERIVAGSNLPARTQGRIRKQFEGQDVTEAVVMESIKAAKEEIDSITGSGAPVAVGDARHIMIIGRPERIQAAMDLMFLAKDKVAKELQDQAPFESIRAAYAFITGDPSVSGMADRKTMERVTGAFDSSTFAYVLGNTLYRKMVNDYKEADDYGVDMLVGSNIRNAKDFRTLESVRVAYLGELPDVNPENQGYPDLGVLTDEEVAYSLNQKGGIVTITRKMIINDDMQLVNRIISRLPRAARMTHAKRAWNILINNSTYGADGLAIFHANHSNLAADALAYDKVATAIKAFMKQSEPGSGLRIGLKPKYLVVPADLWDTARTLNRTPGIPGDSKFGNPVYLYFGENNERIFVNPFMTDANDWLLIGDTMDADILEAAYLNGQREPEMFVANLPTAGQTFYQDQIQYKVRHEYEFAAVDYRNVYKSVVA